MCGAPSTIFHLGHIVVEFRRSPTPVEHHHRHHAVVLTELISGALLDRSPGCVIELYVCQELGGAGVTVLGSVRTGKTYDYFLYVASTLPLRSTRVLRQHSPLSLLCITMILRVCRKILKLLRSPTVVSEPRFYGLILFARVEPK